MRRPRPGPSAGRLRPATDLQLQAEILSYSRARGAFVGVSIDGSVDLARSERRSDVLPAARRVPGLGVQLLQTLTAYSAVAAGRAAPVPAAAGRGRRRLGCRRAASAATPKPRGNNSTAPRGSCSANLDENWKRYLALPPRSVHAEPGAESAGDCSRRLRATKTSPADPNTRPCKPGPSSSKRSARCGDWAKCEPRRTRRSNCRRRRGRSGLSG